MTGDFDREVDEWFEELESRLAPAGRITPLGPAEDDGELRPLLSHPSTLAPRQPAGSVSLPDPAPEPEAAPDTMGLARRESQLASHKRELVRIEALVDVMKELATEIRSVRRDVDQIKAVIGKLRRLAEVKRRSMQSPAMRTIHPSG